MWRNYLKKLTAVVIATSILVGCTHEGEAPSLRTDSINTPQSSTIIDTDEIWNSIKLSDTRYNIETVESIPEMKEVSAKVAVATNIADGASLISYIEKHGLNHPFEYATFQGTDSDSYNETNKRYRIFRYLICMKQKDNEELIYQNGGYNGSSQILYHVPKTDFIQMAEQYMANPLVKEKMQYMVEGYYRSDDSEYIDEYLDFLDSESFDSDYKIGWVDQDNLRYVLVTDFANGHYENYQKNDVMKMIFQKNESGIYQFLNGEFTKDSDYYIRKTAPENMVEWKDTSMASGIIGGINEYYIAIDEWDKTIYVYLLDPNTQEIVETFTTQEDLLSYSIKEDKFFLYFANKVLMLDEKMDIVQQVEVPQLITDMLAIGNSEYTVLPEDANFTYCSMYDVSKDLSLFVYSTQEGCFLYDVRAGKNTKIYDSKIIDPSDATYKTSYFVRPEDDPPYLKTLYSPFFSIDSSRIYGFLPVWEGDTPIAYYDIDTEKITEWDIYSNTNVDPTLYGIIEGENSESFDYEAYDKARYEESEKALVESFVLPVNRGLNKALSSVSFRPSIVLGQNNFYLVDDIYFGGNTLYKGTFANPNVDDLVTIELKDEFTFRLLLSDEKAMLMSDSGSNQDINHIYETQYFILDTSGYLP